MFTLRLCLVAPPDQLNIIPSEVPPFVDLLLIVASAAPFSVDTTAVAIATSSVHISWIHPVVIVPFLPAALISSPLFLLPFPLSLVFFELLV